MVRSHFTRFSRETFSEGFEYALLLEHLSHFLCCVLWGGRGGLHCVNKREKKEKKKR